MPALRSSVLIIGHPDPTTVAFGADFAESLEQAGAMCRAFAYPVVVVPTDVDSVAKQLPFLDLLNERAPHAQRVMIQNGTTPENLRRLINKGHVFKILAAFDDRQFDLTIQEALEEFNLVQQNTQLLHLVNEQNEWLKRLSADLEERVQKRQKHLAESRQKLLVTNHRLEALHRALVAVHRATSIGEMERLVNEALSGAIGLSWTRILFESQSHVDTEAEPAPRVALFKAPLVRGKETLGHIYFAREESHPFSRDEAGFLTQIAEAVALSIDRLTKLEQSETLKQQWEATFNAILEPVSVIDSDYNLLRTNRTFAAQSGTPEGNVAGRKCYEALFGKTAPCESCKLNTTFRLKPGKTVNGRNVIFEVFSQSINRADDDDVYVNMYHDVTAQLRLERQILDSAKMAELGTIGSSIAHELNNPLGGMLSFLQLIKMDLKGDETYKEDIEEMERGAQRCREIVHNLLGFTRKPSGDEAQIVDLREVLFQALKITELQTRAMGISVVQELPNEAVPFRGHFNLLAQAFRNFLQNAQEAIAEELRKHVRYNGEIRVRIRVDESHYHLEIIDNGVGIDPRSTEQIYNPLYTTKDPVQNPGLGLTVALQIITDHGGNIEISAAGTHGTTAKISFPRPVL